MRNLKISFAFVMTFHNRQSGSNAPLISDNSTFQVDYSLGALNMHVASGLNVIEYTFYSCDLWGVDSNGYRVCSQAKTVREQGTSTINITYEEKHLEGVREISDCSTNTRVN